MITYTVSGDHRRPRHRPPPTSPSSSQSPTPSDIEVRPTKYPCISCVVAQIGYVVAQVALHVQFTSPSGPCFAGVLINFRSGKFQALDMSFLAKVMPDFFMNSGMTCARICTSLIFEL